MAPAQENLLESSDELPTTAESKEKHKQERSPPPAWLQKSFVQTALKQECDTYGGIEEQVTDIEVEYATAVGENYCSRIFRIRCHLQGRPVPRSLLVKTLPEGEAFQQIVEETRIFEKESHMFSEVVPAMEALLEEATPGRYPPLSARCLRHGVDPSRFIVVQDLCPEGFSVANRHKGLDLPHALVAVKALGRFHGASSVLWKRQPELFEMLDSPYEQGFGKVEEVEDFLIVAADSIASWEDMPSDYHKKIRSLKGKFFDKIKEIHHVRPGKFNVLSHGDFWLNNMLFRHEGDDVREVRFVDLQMCHITNLAFDLIHLRYTSIQEEIFFEHWDTLLEAYQTSLEETLHALGEESPSMADIREELDEAKLFVLMAALMWLPVVRLNTGKYDVEDALTNGMSSQSNVYNTAVFRHWMKKLLPLFDSCGILDL